MRITLLVAAAACAFSPLAGGQTPSQDRDKPRRFVAPAESAKPADIGARAEAILARLAEGGDFAAAVKDADALWRYTVAWMPLNETESFRLAGLMHRQVTFAAAAARMDPDGALEMFRFLRSCPTFNAVLHFLIIPEAESAPEVFRAVGALRTVASAKDFERHAHLAAAIAVVHDRPVVRRVNENTARGAGAGEVFAFFSASESGLLFKPAEMPPELLVYTVSAAASIEELRWAQQKYRAQRDIGQRYKEIKYDTAHFKKGTPKKVSELGFTLQNILKFGGVCADQAHFAATVGQALGVPCATVSGQSAEVSHAWVGFLKGSGGRGVEWNFDSGRYDDYDVVRGSVMDPQTGQSIADGNVAILAEAVGIDGRTRQAGIALVDAAMMARFVQDRPPKDRGEWPPVIEGLEPEKGAKARDLSTRSQLEVLEAGLRVFPASPRGWYFLVGLAKDGRLSLAEKQAWGGTLDKLTGGKYPDFSMDVLLPMVQTVKEPAERSTLLDAMFGSFRSRPDLAAKVRMTQGEMWEKAGDLERAQRAYDEIAEKFLSDGPFAVAALSASEKLLGA
ncbi:MAG: transglutaminase domain-containing protein, partial [Phycisphaerales bacterium]